MKVKQLIEILKTMDGEKDILRTEHDYEWGDETLTIDAILENDEEYTLGHSYELLDKHGGYSMVWEEDK